MTDENAAQPLRPTNYLVPRVLACYDFDADTDLYGGPPVAWALRHPNGWVATIQVAYESKPAVQLWSSMSDLRESSGWYVDTADRELVESLRRVVNAHGRAGTLTAGGAS